MTRSYLFAAAAFPFLLGSGSAALAQHLDSGGQGVPGATAVAVQPPTSPATPPNDNTRPPPTIAGSSQVPVPGGTGEDQIRFSAATLDYAGDDDIVTATGDVRMERGGDRLRADRITWNRKTGQVAAFGNVTVVNAAGDTAYGDRIVLTDTLKDGVIDNMLVVLPHGGRLAATSGTRAADESITLQDAAYTPCSVIAADGCPKSPSWKITAVQVIYRPSTNRIFYKGARLHLFGLPSLPLPVFSHPAGGGSDSGLLSPEFRYSRTNGLELGQPYLFTFGPAHSLVVTPRVYSAALPMLQLDYRSLVADGAYRIGGFVTASRRSDAVAGAPASDTPFSIRGYVDGVARFQFDPNWSLSGSLRVTSDRTFLRRYDISSDDRLRTTASLERIDAASYFAITGWAVQTLRLGDRQGLQPIALPEVDYRRLLVDPLFGGRITLQLNSLALTRTAGQDTQRAFAAARWELRRITPWGQELTLTAYARGDVYHTSDVASTSVASYRGASGVTTRAIAALAVDVKWPLTGGLFGGTQQLTPRFQIVAAPPLANQTIPNEDARAVDLEDSNLFALNRFPGYDRFEDSTRFTYGLDWAVALPGASIDASVGQSYRLNSRPTLFAVGTGLSDRRSDVVGRTEIRFRDLVSVIHRYRLHKGNLEFRSNELDATIGSRASYFLVGYLRLNRDITPALEDLQDREEVRLAARVQITRFWSAFGSTVIDLTGAGEAVTTSYSVLTASGFDPVRHRIGIGYEDDCLKLGITWRRDYQDTGDARRGNSYLVTLAFKNLGR